MSGLFTTHTPVPAGHDKFEEELFQRYMYDFANQLGMPWTDFMNMGREVPGDLTEKFSVTVLLAILVKSERCKLVYMERFLKKCLKIFGKVIFLKNRM